MTENTYEDFSGMIVRGCPVCGTLETEFEDGVQVEMQEVEGTELDVPFTMVFCSAEHRDEWLDTPVEERT